LRERISSRNGKVKEALFLGRGVNPEEAKGPKGKFCGKKQKLQKRIRSPGGREGKPGKVEGH